MNNRDPLVIRLAKAVLVLLFCASPLCAQNFNGGNAIFSGVTITGVSGPTCATTGVLASCGNNIAFQAIYVTNVTDSALTPGQCVQASTGGLLITAACSSTANIVFPQTISGTGINSGGIPYMNSATQMSSSGVLTQNCLVKGGGVGAAPTSSVVCDNGTTVSTGPEPLQIGAATCSVVSGGFGCIAGSTSGAYTLSVPAVSSTYDATFPTPATGTAVAISETVCSGTISLPTPSSMANATKYGASTSAPQTTTCTGALEASDTIHWAIEGDVSGVVGYEPGALLSIVPFLTNNTINIYLYNGTGSTISTVGAVTINYRVVR